MGASITSPASIAGDPTSEEAIRDVIGTALVAGEAIDITVNDGADSITVLCEDASDTNKGVVELATIAETSTGTDAARAVTPDALAGSIHGEQPVDVEIFAYATPLATGDGKVAFPIPSTLNGMNLVDAEINVFAKSTSGTPTVQIARGRRPDATTTYTFVDMLSTALTIDVNEFDSTTAAVPKVINASNDDVATGDLIRFDVDVAGTGATGLWARLIFRLP